MQLVDRQDDDNRMTIMGWAGSKGQKRVGKTVKYIPGLVAEYRALWDSMEIDPARISEGQKECDRIRANQVRYESVVEKLTPGCPPWAFIGVIHALESDCKFTRHLHNGDPLETWTTHEPKGRPVYGAPPFKWEESAVDALRFKRLHLWTEWTIEGMLWVLEKWNGLGYRKYHPETPTPYLWAGTNHYKSGLYVADGKWSPTAKSKQLGGAVLLRLLSGEF